MLEILPNIFIENSYSGTTLGVINNPHGLILIDAPIKADDSRTWKSSLLNLGGGVDRLLVNLDAHPDRTLGIRAMESTVVGHEKMAQVFKNRPTATKAQTIDTGSEWEQIANLGANRWIPPEISFTETMKINWGESSILLEYHPGPNSSAIWVHLPAEKALFIGDLVVCKQPPFLSNALFDEWINQLRLLTSDAFQGYFIIGGRNGLIHQDDIHRQMKYLVDVKNRVEVIKRHSNQAEQIEKTIPTLMQSFPVAAPLKYRYEQRLRWGLTHLVSRNPRTSVIDGDE